MKILKITAVISALLPTIAFAAVDSQEKLIGVFERIANFIYTFFLIAAVITFLLAAFKFLTATSNPDNAKDAKQMLVYTIIAIAIAMFAGIMPNLISSALFDGDSGNNTLSPQEIQRLRDIEGMRQGGPA